MMAAPYSALIRTNRLISLQLMHTPVIAASVNSLEKRKQGRNHL
jgi:hypothetical protein